jgi:hypothetical protein
LSTTELVARARLARFAEESSDRQEESEEHDRKPKHLFQTVDSEMISFPETLRKSVPPTRGVLPDIPKDVPPNHWKEKGKNKHEHNKPRGPHPFSVASPKHYQCCKDER